MFNLFTDLWYFFFPRFCVLCDERLTKTEQCLCVNCLSELPRTNAHRIKENLIEQIFWGCLPIQNATSFFYYTNDEMHSIIHKIKYHDQPLIAERLSEIMTKEILESDFFDEIDIIIPVPVHWHRYIQRGYNQSDYIARGISRATNIPIGYRIVERIIDNESQTRMSSMTRRSNVKDIFRLKRPDEIEGKHVLIVDDVITTGSTIIALGEELVKAKGVKISVISMAYSTSHVIA